jgi:holo-[acyl-carrier protein] synthase
MPSGTGSHIAVIYTGIDMIEIDRIAAVAARYPSRFLEKIYTRGEQAYCRGRAPQLASRFAAKEAVMKLLGTGVRGLPWKDVEVVRERGRAPEIVLHGKAKAVGERLGITRIALSLTHSREYAVASVVGEARDGASAGGPGSSSEAPGGPASGPRPRR